jgi:hypothetical protein
MAGALYQNFLPERHGCTISFDLGELIDAVYDGPRADKFFFEVFGSVNGNVQA